MSSPQRRKREAGVGKSVELPGLPGVRATEGALMSLFTTWRIGGPADLLVRTANPSQLIKAVRWGRSEGMPIHVIGGGSNLLVGDRGVRGLVIVSRTPGQRAEALTSVEEREEMVRLRVAAQAPLSWTGRFCSERGWAGMDWGVGLPGTIGGATVNNAGAHGTEQIDHLAFVTVIDEVGELVEHPASWLGASYRYTRLKAQEPPRSEFVVEVSFDLPRADPRQLTQLADEHAEYRHRTQPTGKCAGSTFTNPEGDFAGRLLEVAGLKAFGVGGVKFSSKHSNFIVNDGSGTAADVRELIQQARERIREQFGIDLHPEIEEIGEA